MEKFIQHITLNRSKIKPIVDFNPQLDQICEMDFTARNAELTDEILGNTDLFSTWVNQKMAKNLARYGIGGYDEHRTIYSRSAHFSSSEEPRRLHLGVDIWAPVGTSIYNFYPAKVHSFANNDRFGDYGATIILEYQLDDFVFYALYGHLSLASLSGLAVGKPIGAGAPFATLGDQTENGHWPPHLHFQLMFDLEGNKGDYPGVCRYSERLRYLANCPDPNLILRETFGGSAGFI